MKKFLKRIFCVLILMLSIFSMTFLWSEKNNESVEEVAVAYYYETDKSYLYNLFHSGETLDSHYNLTKYYPLINENQTDSNLWALYLLLSFNECIY